MRFKNKIGQVFIIILGLLIFNSNQVFAITDAQIKQILIKQSIADYSGNCPCPYNTARNGSRCGGRSAYSREGGYAPLCYPEDVTKQMINDYRKNHK